MVVPRSTQYSFKRGDQGTGVWAIQRCLNGIRFSTLVEDGDYGAATESEVRRYQEAVNLVADGVTGPQTQRKMVLSCLIRVDPDRDLPTGLGRSVIEGEGGNLIAAVNWSVAGGVDCGFTQRRIYEQADGTYSDADIKRAFDSRRQISLLRTQLLERQRAYASRTYVASRSDTHEFAWRLAILHHNWPYAANRLADGYKLSDQRASWVPAGTRFDDGASVITYADWAKYYAMGAPEHRHNGKMVKYVRSWT